MIEKGSRERIEIERKRQKGNELRISRETSTLASAVVQLPQGTEFPD